MTEPPIDTSNCLLFAIDLPLRILLQASRHTNDLGAVSKSVALDTELGIRPHLQPWPVRPLVHPAEHLTSH